jgi:hypothetical protein
MVNWMRWSSLCSSCQSGERLSGCLAAVQSGRSWITQLVGPGSSASAMRCTLTVLLFMGVISLKPASARTWHVPGDAQTIQAGINLGRAGDDVIVAPGTYLEHDIVMRAGVWVLSEQGSSVTRVDAQGAGRGFDCANFGPNTMLRGFQIINGSAESGGGVRCTAARVTILDCVITGCSAGAGRGGGIYASDSDITIEQCNISDCDAYLGGGICVVGSTETVRIVDCVISNNHGSGGGGGISVLGRLSATILRCVISGNLAGPMDLTNGGGILGSCRELDIQECLIVHNTMGYYSSGAGIFLYTSSGSISNCTVAFNTGSPIAEAIMIFYDSNAAIDRSIIAFNDGVPITCWGFAQSAHCCDVFGNREGDEICAEDLGGNFAADPLFCNPGNDYTLDGASPCLPGNHPQGVACGLIGAREQGCGATPVERTTWGQIKARYGRH